MRPYLLGFIFFALLMPACHILYSQNGLTSYFKTDYFEDNARIKKMEKAFPAVQIMYENYARKNKIPGLAFGIVSGGKLIYFGSTGFNNLTSKIPVTTSSVFRIASMTKSFTALAILQLKKAGKLRLDDPVIQYIPELKKTSALIDNAPPITIRHLLTHTAGLPEDNPWADRQLAMTVPELLSFINNGLSMANVPGQAFEYSNLGFALLGQIITVASGLSFEKYITDSILHPLGMYHTYWEYDLVPKDKLVQGYQLISNKWQDVEILHSGAFGAAGGSLTSVEDFSKYMILHLSAWPIRSEIPSSVCSQSLLREMHVQGPITKLVMQSRDGYKLPCPTIFSYNCGLGWSENCSGRVALDHSGGLPGFGSNWSFLPDYDIAVVSMANLTYASTSGLDRQVIDSLIAIAKLQPRILPVSTILKQRQHELIRLLPDWNNAKRSGIFSSNFFKDYSIDSLQQEAQSLFKKAGKILSVSEMYPVNQLRGYFIMKGEHASIDIWFTLTPENPALIQEYNMQEGRGKY